jgi:hypothetical protein
VPEERGGWRRLLRTAKATLEWWSFVWPLVGGSVWAAAGWAAGVLEGLSPTAIVERAGVAFALGTLGSVAIYVLYLNARAARVRARIVRAYRRGEQVIARRGQVDHPSWARLIDEWRDEVGRLPAHLADRVLRPGPAPDTLIHAPVERLRRMAGWPNSRL